MILVVCAVAAELGGFAHPACTIVAVGVGPVEAALGTARALAARRYAYALNVGIAGGFAGRAPVGATVAITRDDYVELGREDGEPLMLPDGLELIATATSDPELLERLRTGAPAATLALGPAITSATVTTTAARAARLAARFDPLAESMEGFAVLRAAAAAGVPALEIRGISNVVGDRATSGWDFRAGSAAALRGLAAVLDVVQASV